MGFLQLSFRNFRGMVLRLTIYDEASIKQRLIASADELRMLIESLGVEGDHCFIVEDERYKNTQSKEKMLICKRELYSYFNYQANDNAQKLLVCNLYVVRGFKDSEVYQLNPKVDFQPMRRLFRAQSNIFIHQTEQARKAMMEISEGIKGSKSLKQGVKYQEDQQPQPQPQPQIQIQFKKDHQLMMSQKVPNNQPQIQSGALVSQTSYGTNKASIQSREKWLKFKIVEDGGKKVNQNPSQKSGK